MNFSKDETVICHHNGKDLTGKITSEIGGGEYEILTYDFDGEGETKKELIKTLKKNIRYPMNKLNKHNNNLQTMSGGNNPMSQQALQQVSQTYSGIGPDVYSGNTVEYIPTSLPTE